MSTSKAQASQDASSATKTAGPSTTSSSSKIFDGQRILLAEDHFTKSRMDILAQDIQSLGGSTVTERSEATVILVNPSAPKYRDETDQAAFLAKSYPQMVQPLLQPYHWVASSRIANKNLPTAQLSRPSPIFVHPDQATFHSPLLVWVSVNIHRLPDSDPLVAKAAVVRLIEESGGLIVEKRSVADLLVVDRETKFYHTALAENVKNKRGWQRFVERQWVEDCVKAGKMKWPPREAGQRGEKEFDSMEEEEPPVKGRGPGRPTGKPRVDYTPEDDDFLCRYLAAYHPTGSRLSRKTYTTLVQLPSLQHITERHTQQSWHEHYKKSAAMFEKRIKRFVDQGIDSKTLKTKDERRKAKENEEQARAAKAAKARAEVDRDNAGDGANAAKATNGTTAVPGGVAEREGARLTQIAADRAAEIVAQIEIPVSVEQAPSVQETAAATVTSSNTTDAALQEEAKANRLPETTVEQATIVASQSKPGASDPATKATKARATSVEASEEITLVRLDSDDEQAAHPVDATTAPQPSTTKVQADKPDTPATGDADNSKAPLATVEARFEIPKPAETKQDVFGTTEKLAPHRALRETAPNSLPPKIQAETKSPKKVRIDLPPEHVPEASAVSGGTTSQAVLTNGHTAPSAEGQSPRIATEIATPIRLSASTRFSTPSVSSSRKRSLLGEKIQSSERKRLRASVMSDRRDSGRIESMERDENPDTVMASTTIPRARILVEPTQVAPPRPAGPMLTAEEFQEKVELGKTVIERQKEEYKRNIGQLCAVYGMGPIEMAKEINSLPRRKGAAGEMYWADVSKGLKEKFGR